VDQLSIYRPDGEPTGAELLDNCPPETQFGRAMRELEVELILARSPQAKGRVERMNGTLQDRLVNALRRAKIGDLDAANRFLDDTFLSDFNAQFKVLAVGAEDWHRPLSAATDLPRTTIPGVAGQRHRQQGSQRYLSPQTKKKSGPLHATR
jgi:hypothetical protein